MAANAAETRPAVPMSAPGAGGPLRPAPGGPLLREKGFALPAAWGLSGGIAGLLVRAPEAREGPRKQAPPYRRAAGAGTVGRSDMTLCPGAPLGGTSVRAAPDGAALLQHLFPLPWEQDGPQLWPLTSSEPLIAGGQRRALFLVRGASPQPCRAVSWGAAQPQALCTPPTGAAAPAGGPQKTTSPPAGDAAGGPGTLGVL